MPYIMATLYHRRKWVPALFVLLSLCPCLAQAKSNMPRGERHESRHEIDQLEQSWREAVMNRNVTAMDGLLSDDYISISANGTLQSKEQTLENLKSGSLKFNSIDISDRKVRFYGETALVTSRAEVHGAAPDGDITGSYRYTRVYVRDPKGDWKIVSFEASRIRQPGERR